MSPEERCKILQGAFLASIGCWVLFYGLLVFNIFKKVWTQGIGFSLTSSTLTSTISRTSLSRRNSPSCQNKTWNWNSKSLCSKKMKLEISMLNFKDKHWTQIQKNNLAIASFRFHRIILILLHLKNNRKQSLRLFLRLFLQKIQRFAWEVCFFRKKGKVGIYAMNDSPVRWRVEK